ncbi:hypothetical protein CF327_g5020, partial [Tilletia walkeri]
MSSGKMASALASRPTGMVAATQPQPETAERQLDRLFRQQPARMASFAAKARSRKVSKLSVSDGMANFGTAISIFNELSDFTGVAGPFLKMGLGVVQEIISIFEEVKENGEACAKFIETALGIYQLFAADAKREGLAIQPGSAAAVLIEPVISKLLKFGSEIYQYAQLSAWRRTLKRAFIKNLVEEHTADLDRSLSMFTARSSFTLVMRSDHALPHAFNPDPITTASVMTLVEEPGQINDAGSSQAPAQIQDAQSQLSSQDQLLGASMHQGLQNISTALKTEI